MFFHKLQKHKQHSAAVGLRVQSVSCGWTEGSVRVNGGNSADSVAAIYILTDFLSTLFSWLLKIGVLMFLHEIGDFSIFPFTSVEVYFLCIVIFVWQPHVKN